MNLARALDVALPDIPARKLAERPPRLDPGTTAKEHIEDGKVMVRIYVPCSAGMYSFPPNYWKLAQMFDGRRSYEEIAEQYSREMGIEYGIDEVKEFAADLENNEFWYKTPQEKNILLMKQGAEERRKKLKTKSRWADLSDVTFPAFNPDPFLDWIYPRTRFVYSMWFTVVSLVAFAITGGITIVHWREIGHDTLAFYSFSNKTWTDVAVMYVLTIFVTAVHEFAHAHACKHYGGRVPAMGFALVYLTPTFYTDTTEGFVQGSRYQRFTIAMAGIWSELILCSIATPVWWGTPPETLLHDGAYFIMMLTGLMSLVVNWNPLMKLDGYYMLCELVQIRDLKEDSTAYVSAWVRRHIWQLPVEVPYVPQRRRVGFAVYALLSGLYSYTVLYIVARFTGNVVRNFSPEWGFVPEIAVALLIFRSRIRLLVNFMKLVYLDKKDRIAAWFTPRRLMAAGMAGAFLCIIPVKRETVTGRFILEPERLAVIRVPIKGTVTHIDVREGEVVAAGQALLEVKNILLNSEYERTQAELNRAKLKTASAAIHYGDYGSARKDQESLIAQASEMDKMKRAMTATSPIAGTVLTARTDDLRGAYLQAGDEALEIGDLSSMRAKIYVSEYDMKKIGMQATGRIHVDGFADTRVAAVRSVAVTAQEMDKALARGVELEGMSAPHYYVVDLIVANADGRLKPGMTGTARVYGIRRSLLGAAWQGIRDFWGRKVW